MATQGIVQMQEDFAMDISPKEKDTQQMKKKLNYFPKEETMAEVMK